MFTENGRRGPADGMQRPEKRIAADPGGVDGDLVERGYLTRRRPRR